MVKQDVLSPGHEAEARLRVATMAPEDAPILDNYLDVVRDEYLQSISSRDDFVGFEHLAAFAEETCIDLDVKPDSFASRVFNPVRYTLKRTVRIEHLDPTEVGLVVKPRKEVDLSLVAPDTARWHRSGQYKAVQVGSLIDFAGTDPMPARCWYDKKETCVLKRFAAFLEAKTAGDSHTEKEELLAGITSRDDFISLEDALPFFPEDSQYDQESGTQLAFRTILEPQNYNPGRDFAYLRPEDIGLVVEPPSNIEEICGGGWDYANARIQVGSLIDFVEGYEKSGLQLFWYSYVGQDLFENLVVYLKDKLGSIEEDSDG